MENEKIIETIIKSFKKARQANDYLTILNNGLALLEYLPALIEYSVTQESEYRKFEARLSDERDDTGKRLTSSYCETQSKATDYYKEWQRTKQFIELVYELSQMAKKLVGSVDRELNAQ